MANTKDTKMIRVKKIMIGCPEDAEREFLSEIKEAVQEFNENQGNSLGIQLETRHWRDGTHSDARNPQESINKQLCNECDYLLAVFYLSSGSAIASEKPGTYEEIEYFSKQKKQVFIHKFLGKTSVDLSDEKDIERLLEYLNKSKKEQNKLYYKQFKNKEELKKGIIEDLINYFVNTDKTKNRNSSKRIGNSKKKDSNPIQDSMKDNMRLYDEWFAIKTKQFNFSFYDKAKDLIAGMQADGSVQYSVGNQERFRTTPTASTLDALYLANLLPESVRYRMQDWIYSSRQDPCDHPKGGHVPDAKDEPGWSRNEGVSVWTTSKALGTLIMTGYYDRPEISQNEEIMQTTYAALEWLVDQEYKEGGWGFQHAPDMEACLPCVTMTALALKVITKFLLESFKNGSPIKLNHDLERKLRNAKSKGITYLLKTMKENKELKHVYWEYNNEPSLTGTVWVLDFINVAQEQGEQELYKRRKEIVSYCVSRLPSGPTEYEEFREEVFFMGGITKYKEVQVREKFYAYFPYHIPVILQSGVNLNAAQNKRIQVCIHALTRGKESYWYGTDVRGSYHQMCFARAMALSVVAFWMRETSVKQIAKILKKDWDPEEYN